MEWMKGKRALLAISAVALVASFAAGRFLAPTKTETVIQTVEVIKEVEKRVIEKGPVRYKKVIVETPGAERVTTVTVEKDPVTITVDRDVVRTEKEYIRETVERKAPAVALFGTVGLGFQGGISPPMYGLGATVRILGPVTIFAQGEAGPGGGSARVGAGLTF